MLTVMKFGGSSVADLAHIRNVAQRCIEKQQAGSQVVVVLSAMGKTTDGLIATAKQITEKPSRREMDMLLATGEQVSVSLMAITMIQMGVSAVSLNAWQVPMHTTSDYQNARFKRIDTERIRKELDDNKIVIVTASRGSTNTMISQRSDAAAPIRLRLPSLQSCTRMSVKSTRM